MTIKKLNEVMRNPKLYAQTKALYSYLYIRADHKTNLSYPPKKQILEELNLTEGLFTQGLAVLEKQGYIKIGTAEGTNKETKETYTYTTYKLLEYAEEV
jgi:DNA-binding MarR family transcriptional regulator